MENVQLFVFLTQISVNNKVALILYSTGVRVPGQISAFFATASPRHLFLGFFLSEETGPASTSLLEDFSARGTVPRREAVFRKQGSLEPSTLRILSLLGKISRVNVLLP